MVFFFTVTLGISIVGMLTLIVLKRVELSSGRTMFVSVRPKVDGFFHSILRFFEQVLPTTARYLLVHLWASARHTTHRTIAWMVYTFEHTLEQTLHTVREKTEVKRGPGQVSAFLREIANHKKELLERSKTERVILDE